MAESQENERKLVVTSKLNIGKKLEKVLCADIETEKQRTQRFYKFKKASTRLASPESPKQLTAENSPIRDQMKQNRDKQEV